MTKKAGRRRNQEQSLLVPLTIRIPQPITDPRVQKALDWIQGQARQRNAAPAAWDLIVAAVNGELGGVALAGSEADERLQKQMQAVDDLLANFVSE
jgi:hypothetical protein